jgi:hypothetical protein
LRRSAILLLALALTACSRKAEAHYRRCLHLRVGMTKDDLLKYMGEPDEVQPYVEGKSLEYLKGRTAYEWSNPATMPGPDHVSVSDATGLVESIRCSNSEITAPLFPEFAAPAAVSTAPRSAAVPAR